MDANSLAGPFSVRIRVHSRSFAVRFGLRPGLARISLEIWQWYCNISGMIPREHYLGRVRKALGRNPVVALLGPRQCGKTTLARQMMPAGHPQYFDLEDPVIAQLLEQPMTALQGLRGFLKALRLAVIELKKPGVPARTRVSIGKGVSSYKRQ